MRCLLVCVLFLCCFAAQPPAKVDPKYVPLAERLFTAPDDAARAALLASSNDLVTPDLVKTLNELAGQVFDRQAFEQALAMYRISCGVARQIGDRRGEAACTFDSGLCLTHLYNRDEGLAAFDEAIALYQTLDAHADFASVLNSVGVTLRSMGDLNSSLPYQQKALEEAALSADPTTIAQSNFNIGTLYKELGRYREAIQSYQKTLDLIRNRPDLDRRVAMVLNNLGDVYSDQHEHDLALNFHEQARALKEKLKVDPDELATSVLSLGVDYQSLQRYDKAIPYFERAAQLADGSRNLRVRNLVLYDYGVALHRMGRSADAVKKLQAALELTDRITDDQTAASCRIELGQIAVEEGRFADGLGLAQQAAEYARRENAPRVLVRADEVIAAAMIPLNRRDEAETVLLEAIRTAEHLRSQLPGESQGVAQFLNEESGVFERMILLQLMNHHPDLALAYSERFKGQALLEILQSGGTQVTKALSAVERKEEENKAGAIRRIEEQMLQESRRPAPDRNRIVALARDLEQARTQYRAYQLSLYSAHPELRVQRVDFEPATAGDLASALPDDQTGLLEYSITDQGVRLFVVTRGARGAEVKAYDMAGDKASLARDVKQFRAQIASRDLGYRKLAASLYQQLIQPARQQLRGKSTLVIVPEGVLWQLPFQALEQSPGRYLVEDSAVFYTPSLSVLRQMQRLHQSRVLAQPRLLAVEAATVPGTQREINGLRRVYGPENVRVYLGAEADHENLKRDAPDFQILHLAAHGVFEDRHPMDSYLVLAKAGKPESGVLAARDMMDLNLRADMVVLSGCETGRSPDNGEGLIGMSWALFIAGAPATVASQWKVESESTSAFMLEFHRNLRGSSKVKALQQAQMAVMTRPEYRHPFYWSGFVLMGEGF
jgi:CHAT domain-containing protein/Tfp pilus assembly protein PilF